MIKDRMILLLLDPEMYYERELKGKTPEEILLIIKELKHQIGMLIHQIERSRDTLRLNTYPDNHTVLRCTRHYLERAKKALVDAGGTYTPSNRECRIAAFHNRLEHLEKIELIIHRDASFSKSYTVTFEEKPPHYTTVTTRQPLHPDEGLTKKEFVQQLRDMHIGEWKRKYYDPSIEDHLNWQLMLSFSNSKRKIIREGINKYPYNFKEFCELIDETIDTKDLVIRRKYHDEYIRFTI